MVRRPVFASIALAILLLALPLLTTTAVGPRVWATPDRPNVALIVLDDLDAALLERMPTVAALLGKEGTTFSNAFVTTSLCCPSRASILRGQYVHNHGTVGALASFARFYGENEASTVATWLDDAGYRTALIGKYMNGYATGPGRGYVPPGWDEWYGVYSDVDFDAYGNYDYELNENGRDVAYGAAPADYLTDVVAGKLTSFVDEAVAADEPFFAYVAPTAPHLPAGPAPRHAETVADEPLPRSASFNEADVSDKPAWVRALPELTRRETRRLDRAYGQRLGAMLAVDELVAALLEQLRATGMLDETYVVLTSDNGFVMGQHRIPLGKLVPYEESIRVPLLVRGPGVAAGRVAEDLVLNLDLAPTIAELAGAATPDFVDGRSLAPLLRGEEAGPPRQAVLVELLPLVYDAAALGTPPGGSGAATPAGEGASSLGWDDTARPGAPASPAPPVGEDDRRSLGGEALAVPPYAAVRTTDRLYVEYATGERELYDLRIDPAQLENVAGDPARRDEVDRLAARLAELRSCAAEACRAAEETGGA